MEVQKDLFGQPIPKRRKKRDTEKTNNLTKAIVKYMNCIGMGGRVNRTGIYNEETQSWMKSHTIEGISDVVGCIKPSGRIMAVEIKVDNDTLTEDQYKYLCAVKRCGGIGMVAKTFDHYYRQVTTGNYDPVYQYLPKHMQARCIAFYGKY